MALYDGFFDAVKDETTGEYDRDYGPGDFTNYFGNVIGSGVCIHDNPDSFKAEYEDGTLYLRPGYLFIKGYWLANKAGEGETASTYKGYAVTLPANMTGSMEVVAHLNLGQRLIEIEVQSVSQSYPDSLVLAIITTTTAEDTRHNTDICGVIDTAGELSTQVEWAVNYINTEIDSKLQQIEQDIAAQDAKLDAKIAEVQAVADSIAPPPVGTIKFSASQDVDENWLKCDGSFINEADYPELVAALGKLIPSADKFQVVSSGEIGTQITNGVVYDGRMWVYSYSTKKLYGVDLESTEAIKEIPVTSEDVHFNNFIAPTDKYPIALSIVPHKVGTGAKLFLAQGLPGTAVVSGSLMVQEEAVKVFLLFQSEFSGLESNLSLSKAFNTIDFTSLLLSECMYPESVVSHIISKTKDGNEVYYFACVAEKIFSWSENDESAKRVDDLSGLSFYNQRISFSHKNKDEAVLVTGGNIKSFITGIFNFKGDMFGGLVERDYILPLNIVGDRGVIFSFTKTSLNVCRNSKIGAQSVKTNISLPNAAKVFIDAGAYLWNKDIYMIFVGTGIIFSRTLEEVDFGYLDTTSVMGTITQFGYLDYSEDGNTLYLLGQDTDNNVKVAKMKLNTLYNYANDGAWLPMIAADGVPAYIRAKTESDPEPPVPDVPTTKKLTVTYSGVTSAVSYYSLSVLFDGNVLPTGTTTKSIENGTNTFTLGIRNNKTYTTSYSAKLFANNSEVASVPLSSNAGTIISSTLAFSDYLASGLTIKVIIEQ